MASWRKAHPQACHVCYAFRFGSNKRHFRASDDGEPSNSAGPPILGQIQAFDLTNVLVAVVRYYGGTNLGVGGLIHAYRISAKAALENAVITEKAVVRTLELTFNYAQMPVVMATLKSLQLTVLEQQLELTCRIVCEIPASDQEKLRKLMGIHHLTCVDHGIKE